MTPLPYQIVIIDELEGVDYAAYRALSDHADVRDISVILKAMKNCSVNNMDRYHSILQTIELHNPGVVQNMIREDENMESIFLKLFEPEIQEREKNAAAAAAAAASAKATAATEAATTAAFAERMVQKGINGHDIADMTGYDRSRIDGIAQRLNRTVNWNEARA